MQVNEYKPLIVAFCCNWCSYAGADLAGNNRLNYPADVKIIRVPCSCRVNPMFVLRAFQRGADGVTRVTVTTHQVTTTHVVVWHFFSQCLTTSALKESVLVLSGFQRLKVQSLPLL